MSEIDYLVVKLKDDMPFLKYQYNVKSLGIFGSYVRGEQKRRSDVDILVEFSEPIGLLAFMSLERYLCNLIGKKVDLVSKKALKPKIGERILNEVIYV